MFALFKDGNLPKVKVVSTLDQFWREFNHFGTPNEVFERQGETYHERDSSLIDAIEETLEPILGQWPQSDTWFHNIDSYGDGIRSLLMRRDVFDPSMLTKLHALLREEHEDFCILFRVTDSLKEESGEDGLVAMTKDRALITRAFLRELSLCA